MRLAVAGLVDAVCLVGCVGSQTAAPAEPKAWGGGTVVQRLAGVWTTMDPQVQGVNDGYQVFSGLYDYLLALEGTKLVPYLASSWTQTPTSVKFTLRRDATCTDGTPLTATVVANSFKRLLLTNATTFGRLKDIFGPPPYAVAGDDSAATLTITIGRPYSGLLDAFSQSNAAIVCPKGLANPAQLTTEPAGSGPFRVASMVQGDSVTLAAQPNWHWGPHGLSTRSPGFPQTVVYKVIANDTTAANLLTTGGLDVASVTGLDTVRLLSDRELIHKSAHPYYATGVIFNQTPGRPGADQAVRKALSTAVSPVAFGQATYGKYNLPSTSFLAPDAQCFDPGTKALMPEQSIAKAKDIMRSAGYQVGSDGTFQEKARQQPITIVVIGSTSYNSGPDYLAAQFSAAGFTVKLNKTDRGSYAIAYLAGNFDVAIAVSAAPTLDPNGQGAVGFFAGPPRPIGSNDTRVDVPAIDSEIAAANASLGAESCKHWATVQEELLRRNVLLPTVAPQYQWFGRGVDFVPAPLIISPVFLKRLK